MIYIILKVLLLVALTGIIATLIPATIVFITIFIVYLLSTIVKLILGLQIKFIVSILSLLITLFIAIFYANIFLNLVNHAPLYFLAIIFIYFSYLNISISNYLIPMSENDIANIENNAESNMANTKEDSMQFYYFSFVVIIYLRFFKYVLMPLTTLFVVFPKILDMLPSFPEYLAYHLVSLLVKLYGLFL